MAPSKKAEAPFSKDERVLCFHHEMLYEAKVLDSKQTDDKESWQYRIHYKGWKNTWDDWVPQDRVRKFNDENRELAAQLHNQMKSLQQKGPKTIGGKKGNMKNGSDFSTPRGSEERHTAQMGRGRGRNRDYDLEHNVFPIIYGSGYGYNTESSSGSTSRSSSGSGSGSAAGPGTSDDVETVEESFLARPSIKLVIPDHIKAMLVDDWENVTKNLQLVPIPSAHPVNSILNDYLAFEKPKRQDGSAQAGILEEVVDGLREYFDKCLGRILLYRFERNQYMDVVSLWKSTKPADSEWYGKTAGDTYGAEHLCRLLVTLPELIAQTNMDLQSVNRLREELSKMTNWLGRNATKYFVSEYETPSQEYIEKARGV